MWILIGVTVCSVMTATLTSALTNVKLEKYDVTTGKRVGLFYCLLCAINNFFETLCYT